MVGNIIVTLIGIMAIIYGVYLLNNKNKPHHNEN